MNTTRFHYKAKNKNGIVIRTLSFDSNNPYKDLAQYINEESVANGDVYVSCEDDYGHIENYRVAKRNPKFINHISGNFPKEYIDFDIKPRYLTCIDEDANHYKYYQIEIDKNGFSKDADKYGTHVTYGRIGGSDISRFNDQTYDYPINMFWIKYYEKISKGYIDQSELKDFSKTEKSVLTDKGVSIDTGSNRINDVFKNLIEHQRNYVKANYDISVPFSQTAIDKTEQLLKEMTKLVTDKRRNAGTFVPEFTDKYKQLISILPRKIDDVGRTLGNISMYSGSPNDFARDKLSAMLEKEQEKFDVFKSFVSSNGVKKAQTNGLDSYNLSVDCISFEEIFTVQDKLQENAYKASNIIKVSNTVTEAKYEQCCKDMHIDKGDRHLLWHGSRTENWWSICTNGLSLNPNAITTGKMFGKGLYFAERSQKSMNYTDSRGSYWAKGNDDRGYLALYEVAMGKAYTPLNALSSSYGFNNLPNGCQSVWAKAGKTGHLINNECVVYKESQCTLKYLVETSTSRTKDYAFNLQAIRKIELGDLKYDKDTDSFYARTTNSINGFPAGTKFTYDANKNTIGVHNGQKYYGFELEALSYVFKNNYADNEIHFKEYVKNLAEGRDVSVKTASDIARD